MSASQPRSPLKFFLLVFALSVPFWLAGAWTSLQLLPGLPVSALMFLCPVTAALILVYREGRTAGMTTLLKRSFDYKRIGAKIWYAPIILLMPSVMALSYWLMRSIGMLLPSPHLSVVAGLALFFAFFPAALGEELGWSGYVIDSMQDQWKALGASIIVGVVWAVWHIVPLVQAQRSWSWIAGWCLCTVAQRILIVWLYNNTGNSVFGAAVFHTTSNVCWQLFPVNGSYFDPWVTGLITASVAVMVTFLWGPRTLARYRNA